VTEVEALQHLIDIARDEAILTAIGWSAWLVAIIIVIFLLSRKREPMSIDEARLIARELLRQMKEGK
jgi:Sec-independent protein translocase protein TatA